MRHRLPIIALLFLLHDAHAATIAVTSNSAGHNDASACVLRDAINASNHHATTGGCGAGSGNDVIVLPAGASIALESMDTSPIGSSSYQGNGLPPIATTITIEGNGATITRSSFLPCDINDSGNAGEFRLFQVLASGILTLHRVRLTNGCANAGPSSSLDTGGAIANAGTVNLLASSVVSNQSRQVGALYNDTGATMLIDHSIVALNHAVSAGGGVYNAGNLTVSASLFAQNSADTLGGGAINNSSFGTALIINSTFTQNSANTDGAIENGNAMELDFTTIVANTGSSGAGGIKNFSGSTKIKNSLIAKNTGGDCSLATPNTTIIGANLDSDASCHFSLSNANPPLGALTNNGGASATLALLSGNPAIDAAQDCKQADGSTAVVVDQRGHARPFGGKCDLGAYENDESIFTNGFDPNF